MDSTNKISTATTTNVQHVAKKSSDELLRKFAELDDEAKKVPKLRRRTRDKVGEGGGDHKYSESPSNGQCSSSLVERRCLLPPAPVRKSALLRQLGIRSRAHLRLRAREIRHKSLVRTIEKTWRKTIEGASRVFMEKHYNRHNRLINDMV